MKDLISIIIPFYNSENTLKDCINSILNQTYTNFEIILVDNSSTDSSKKIIDNYKKKYKFIRYFNIKEQNVSLARNKGLLEAIGNLICFVDSDDQIHKAYLEILYNNLKNSDMSICSFSTNLKKIRAKNIANNNLTVAEMFDKILKNKNIQGYVWNKLFKTNIIKEYRIKFNKNLVIGEDIDFVFEYLKHCNNIAFTKQKLYYYNKKHSNTVNNVKNYKYVLDSWENMFNKYSKLKSYKNMDLIYYYYLKKYYEIKFYDKGFKIKDSLYFSKNNNITLKFKLFLYKYFTYIIILAKKVRDRI